MAVEPVEAAASTGCPVVLKGCGVDVIHRVRGRSLRGTAPTEPFHPVQNFSLHAEAAATNDSIEASMSTLLLQQGGTAMTVDAAIWLTRRATPSPNAGSSLKLVE